MTEFYRLHDLIFLDLASHRFHHHDGFLGADNDHIESAGFQLRIGRIDHELIVDAAHPHGTDWIQKGDVGQVQCSRGSIDGDDIRIHLGFGGENHGDDLCFTTEVLWKERPHRTID